MINPRDIQQVAIEIAEKFRPERIVLLGSYAYGKPTEDSDVDLLILVNGKRVHNRDIRIRLAIDFPFAVDLIVRSVDEFKKRIGWGDCFLMKIAEDGAILYESPDTPANERGRRLTAESLRTAKAMSKELARKRESARKAAGASVAPVRTSIKKTWARRP